MRLFLDLARKSWRMRGGYPMVFLWNKGSLTMVGKYFWHKHSQSRFARNNWMNCWPKSHVHRAKECWNSKSLIAKLLPPRSATREHPELRRMCTTTWPAAIIHERSSRQANDICNQRLHGRQGAVHHAPMKGRGSVKVSRPVSRIKPLDGGSSGVRFKIVLSYAHL